MFLLLPWSPVASPLSPLQILLQPSELSRTLQFSPSVPAPSPTPFTGASAPDGQHGIDLPDQVPQLVHDLLQLLVLLLELLQGETERTNADRVKHFTWTARQFGSPGGTPFTVVR